MPFFLKKKSTEPVKPASETEEEREPDPFSIYTHEKLREEIQTLLSKIEKHPTREIHRILVCSGPSAGKSSLINNILSAMNCRLIQVAKHGDNPSHVTRKYMEFKMTIRDEQTRFMLCDTRGAESSADENNVFTGLRAAVMGQVNSGEDMNYDSKITSKEIISQVASNDSEERGPTRLAPSSEETGSHKKSVVAILFVISADKLEKNTFQDSELFKSIIPIYDFANTNGIPSAFFITKCDMKDDEVDKDIKVLYKSKLIQDAKNILHSSCQGFPPNRIFPIVNYTNHMDVKPGMMLQTLYAMKHVMADIYDYLYTATFRV